MAQRDYIAKRPKLMILAPIEYDLGSLFDSDNEIAICRTSSEHLKSLILLVRGAGYGVIVVETASGDHYVIAVADPVHQGNLIGDSRRWNREHGYQFNFKRAAELSSPNGRIVEIARTYTIASGFTHWGLAGSEFLPIGYLAL